MIHKDVIRQVLLDNRREVERHEIVARELTLDDRSNHVLIGARRAGKSYMLYRQMQLMLASGKTWDDMLYVNFEDERLSGMETMDLNLLLEVHGSLSAERPVLFLDELQNVPGWDKFARRLADSGYRAFITGSNARMLSSDVATTLGGRYVSSEVYPYSFREFLRANGVAYDRQTTYSTEGRAAIERMFAVYFRFGGFPECAVNPSKRDYLMSVYQKIYLGDIAARNRIHNTFALRLLFRKLAESVGEPVSFTRLVNVVSSVGGRIGKATLINYMDYSNDAFLTFPIHNIADNLTARATTPKYYFIDNGIISLLALDVETSLLENMVAIELLRRYGTDGRVFFYRHSAEVDFYVPDDGLAIQVCYSPHKSDETWRRETSSLISISKRLACKRLLMLTYNDEESIEKVGGRDIEVLPMWRWLLETTCE